MSDIKFFRDLYKHPDVYGQKLSREEKEEIEEYNKNKPQRERDLSEKKFGPTAQKYYESVELIKSADLKSEIDNQAEREIIESRKKIILNYFSKVLEDVKNYLTQVTRLELQKKDSYDDLEKYQAAISSSDGLRRSYHNTLISDLKILVRLININFNKDFPEEIRLRAEAKAQDRKSFSFEQLKDVMSQREYFEFPYKQGVFIDMNRMPKDPQGEREYIASWAFNIYNDLTSLSEKIIKEAK
ncbi:MAG: hypothetical protein WCY43_03960 [Patescibacteria group bacterium]|nr:hypothetical protein [Patescibacteria group bacterium]